MKVNFKWSICRVCLEEVENDGKSIFDYDDDKQEICAKLKECGGIEIYRKSNLPGIICKSCLLHLNIAYHFKTVCQSSQEKLQTFLERAEVLNKSITTECSELDVDDLMVNSRNSDDNIIDNEQYFVYYTDPDEIDENNISSVVTNTAIETMQNFKQEYAVEEEYIIETEDEPSKDGQSFQNTKGVEIYEFNANTDNDFKQDSIDDKTPNILIYESKVENCEQKQNLAEVNEKTDNFKERRKYVKKNKLLNGEQKFVCDVCGNQYERKYTLQQHMKWHSDEKPYACEICGKAFVTEYQIHRHMRVHTGEKPYQCQFCNRKFSDASTRMKHERIHTNIRPFKCDVCEKSFNYSDVLRAHKMTHSGEKPYACELCGKRFSQMHHLKAHLQTISHRALADNEKYYSV